MNWKLCANDIDTPAVRTRDNNIYNKYTILKRGSDRNEEVSWNNNANGFRIKKEKVNNPNKSFERIFTFFEKLYYFSTLKNFDKKIHYAKILITFS